MKSLSQLLYETFCNVGDSIMNSRLCEMALDRKEYLSKIENLVDQVLENMVLVKMGSLYNTKKYGDIPYTFILNKEHWKTELIAHLRKMSSYKIKNDNVNKRKSALNKLWDDLDLNSTTRSIILLTSTKIETENLSTDSNVYHDSVNWVMNEFKNNHISDIIVSENEIKTYVNSI